MYTKLLFFPKESRASWRPNVREKEKVAGALFFSAPLPNGILLLCRGEEGNRDWQTTFSILSLSSGLEWKWGKFFFLLPTSFRYQRTGSLDVVITILMALMNSAQKVQISCLSTFFQKYFSNLYFLCIYIPSRKHLEKTLRDREASSNARKWQNFLAPTHSLLRWLRTEKGFLSPPAPLSERTVGCATWELGCEEERCGNHQRKCEQPRNAFLVVQAI